MKTKSILIPAIIVILSGLLVSCATIQYPGSRLNPTPIAPFDIRVTKAVDKQSQDYYRSKRVGFTATNLNYRLEAPFTLIGLSPEQKQIVQLIGIPEYERTFPNKSGKRVEEWIYLEQDYLAQFIYGTLIYIGPVDDLEKTLIDLGPPADMYSFDFAGMRKDIFKYKSRYEIYTFQDGKLIVVQ